MKQLFFMLLWSISLVSIAKNKDSYSFINTDNTIRVNFNLTPSKSPVYKVFYKDKLVLFSNTDGENLKHFIFFFKGNTFECVAESYEFKSGYFAK
mgnify:CR=1 FL=1